MQSPADTEGIFSVVLKLETDNVLSAITTFLVINSLPSHDETLPSVAMALYIPEGNPVTTAFPRWATISTQLSVVEVAVWTVVPEAVVEYTAEVVIF